MMDVMEHQMTVTIDGEQRPISPKTKAETVYTEKGERVSDVLDRNTPIEITYQDYLEKIRTGEITDDDKTFYNVIDDMDGITISDSIVSRSSTFSSKKIVEMIASGGGGGSGGGGSSMRIYTQMIQPTDWTKNTNPSTATMIVSGISDDSMVMVTLSNKLNAADCLEQSTAVTNAKIFRIKQADSTLVFYAYGVVPTIPIQLDISIIN